MQLVTVDYMSVQDYQQLTMRCAVEQMHLSK